MYEWLAFHMQAHLNFLCIKVLKNAGKKLFVSLVQILIYNSRLLSWILSPVDLQQIIKLYYLTVGLTSIIFSINYDCEGLNHVVGTHTPPEVLQLPAVEDTSKYDHIMTSLQKLFTYIIRNVYTAVIYLLSLTSRSATV